MCTPLPKPEAAVRSENGRQETRNVQKKIGGYVAVQFPFDFYSPKY
jgi:hypothetical protein